MLLSMVILYLTASLISSSTSQSFKKPWKSLKLTYRNISPSSVTKNSPTKSNSQEDPHLDDNDSSEEEEEEETELIAREPLEIRI